MREEESRRNGNIEESPKGNWNRDNCRLNI